MEDSCLTPSHLGLATKSAMFVLRNRLGAGKKPFHVTDKSESMPFSLAPNMTFITTWRETS
jgi:hypothetical protein